MKYKCLIIIFILLVLSCEHDYKHGIEADTPELQTIATGQAQILVDTFHLQPIGYVYLQTEKSVDSEGRFYIMDYSRNETILVYGVDFDGVIRVSDRYFPNVIRHELLHVYGYNHEQQIINGVKVRNYVDMWE